MNDARLKSLFRQLTAAGPREAVVVEDVLEPLSRSGYPDEEGTPLDRVATSAAHADILRTALALDADTVALGRELAALRAPRRIPAARGWIAIAAGIGAAAILVAGLRSGTQPSPVAEPDYAGASILSVSFESPPQPDRMNEPREATPIFSAGFDS